MAAMSALEALAAVEEGAVIVDIRSPAEFEERHIQGALSLHGAALDKAISGEDEGGVLRESDGTLKAVVVHCASGLRSKAAAQKLAEAGFAVVDLGSLDD